MKMEEEKSEKTKSSIIYWTNNLRDSNDKKRIDSGVAVVNYLSGHNWDDDASNELSSTLKQLVIGTSSPIEKTRKSFCSTLTAYLKTNPDTPTEKILEIMEKKLKPCSNNHKNKGENGNVYAARILTCGSLIRSEVLKQSSAEVQNQVLDQMITAGKKRSHLSFLAFSFVIVFLKQINKKSFKNVWPLLEKELIKPWSEQTLETFYALLVIQDKFPSVVHETFNENFGGESIINANSLENITKILTEIPRIVCYKQPVYQLFIEKLCETEYVDNFWSAIDQRFAKPSKTDEFVATEMFRLLLESLKDKSLIPNLLTEKYLQFMLRKCKFNKKNQKDEVVTAFKNVLTSLTNIVSGITEDKVKMSVLKKLMLHPGDIMIEKLTGTKIIQLITDSLAAQGVKKLSKIYREIIENPQRDNEIGKPWTNEERIYAAQLLTKLLGHKAMITDHDWRLKLLKFLFRTGLCESPEIGVELASSIKVSFYRALDNKLPKLSDLRKLLSDLVTFLDEEVLTNEDMKLRTPLEEKGTAAWKKMTTLMKQLEENNENFAAFFHTMGSHMGLQLFNNQEMAISSIDELKNCFVRLRKKSRKSKDKAEDDEPEWTEVVVDLILSLLSRKEHLLRSVVLCVFPQICSNITSASLHQILAVLDVANTKGPLSVKGDEDSSDSDDESENEEESDENESDSEEESEPEDEEHEEDETVNDILRLKVSQALGNVTLKSDDEEMDVDDIDDEEGKRLDENLAAAFKMLRENRKNQSKKQEKPAEVLTHFRIRVIDLLEAYLQSCPPMAFVLDMVVPLFMLLEFCIIEPHQKPLENKVRGCLNKLAGLKKFKDTEGVDGNLLKTLIEFLVEKKERSASVHMEMTDQLSKCCMFLVRCSQQANSPMEEIVSIYKEKLIAFFSKKNECKLFILILKDTLKLCWEGNWAFVPLLVDYAFEQEIKFYKRIQAVELLLVFYQNSRLLQDSAHKSTRMEVEQKLCKKSIKFLREPSDEQKYVQKLFTLLHTARTHHLPEAWNWEKMAEVMEQFKKMASLKKDAKKSFNRFAAQIGVAALNKNAVKAEPTNGVEVSNGKVETENQEQNSSESEEEEEQKSPSKTKKKKNNNEKHKLKKEARELRAKAMTEGLESFNFSSVVIPNGVSEHDGVQNGNKDTGEKVKISKNKRSINESNDRPTKKKKSVKSES